MTQLQTLFFGVFLVALGFVFAGGNHPAAALSGGPYMLMQHSNTTANVGVFRLDTASGAVSYCYMTGASTLKCTEEVE